MSNSVNFARVADYSAGEADRRVKRLAADLETLRSTEYNPTEYRQKALALFGQAEREISDLETESMRALGQQETSELVTFATVFPPLPKWVA